MYGVLMPAQHDMPLGISFHAAGQRFSVCVLSRFWAMPTMILSESAAAATFGLITSVSQLGGFAGPYVIGFLK